MAIELNVTEDHPLALELASLRTAVARYQVRAVPVVFYTIICS